MTGKIDKELLVEQTEMTPIEVEYVVDALSELQEKMIDWLETPVSITLWRAEEDTLKKIDNSLDQYVVTMEVNGRELVSFTDDTACDLADTLSIWAIRHLIISCGSHNKKLELPEPAQA